VRTGEIIRAIAPRGVR